MVSPADFDDIRPYTDSEVRPTLDRLIKDNEFIDTIAKLKLPSAGKFAAPMVRPMVRKALSKELDGIASVDTFQQLLEGYMKKILDETTSTLSVSGLENLQKDRAYCFVSNHRDIAMDPAFVNWVLYQNGFKTLRIAIGDNLLTKPFASDLMRLNKSFIVNRSAKGPREKLKAAKKLSAYIQHSLNEDNANIWIAQREGRAKDGLDITNPAIISMLALSKQKTEAFGDYMARANIVPVSISYELDPCDVDKARELTITEQKGSYEKAQHEDVQSIAKGITGNKSKVHVAFGQPMGAECESVEDVVEALNTQILDNYVLQTTNCLAYEWLEKRTPTLAVGPEQTPFDELECDEMRRVFNLRVEQCDSQWRNWLLKIYANPVYAKLAAQP